MKSFSAQVQTLTDSAIANADLIKKAAAQTTFEAMTRRQASVKETGGSYEIGKVPVDKGELIGSQIAQVNDSTVAQGEVDYSVAIASSELGDTLLAGFTDPKAPYLEYGTDSDTDGVQAIEGRFFVREAVLGWPAAVSAAVAKFKV